MDKVFIIDSGTSNLFSIKNAIRKVGINAQITSKRSDIDQSEILILPGVGSFKQAMHNLKKKKLLNQLEIIFCLVNVFWEFVSDFNYFLKEVQSLVKQKD